MSDQKYASSNAGDDSNGKGVVKGVNAKTPMSIVHVVGKIISMSNALGPDARLVTCNLYEVLNQCCHGTKH